MVRLLWLVVGAWGLMGGWPLLAAEPPTKAEREAASWACQMRSLRPDGTMPADAPCVCRARAGLPEAKACKRARGQR